MKKFLMVIFASVLATSGATAGVGILWSTIYGAYDHNAMDVTSDPSPNQLLANYGALWQLIFAGADNIANPLDSANLTTGAPGIQDDYVTGDDVVWGQRTIPQGGGTAPEDGTVWNNWMINQSGSVVYENLSWSTAGFVYQRVFETPMTGTDPGSYFHQSPLVALNTGYAGQGAPTQDIILDTPEAGFKTGQQIPEPATMGLLGLGALVMAIRRRRS